MKPRRDTCVFILLLLLAASSFAANSITGEWQGTVGAQHLNVRIEQASDGSLTGQLTAVDQGNVTLPFDNVTFTPPALRLELKRAGAAYDGKLSDDGSEIAGTWQQGGNSVPLTFHRPGAAVSKPTLAPRTIGKIALQPCRTPDGNTEGLCGKYDVYENRQSQKRRKIALNVMLLPALTDKPAADPWFAIAGGPGQSAVDLFPLLGVTTRIRQQRDVVLVDQRGTGGSNRLACPLRDPNDLQALLSETISLDKVRACRADLEKKADLTQYATSIAVEDLDELRQALGYDKINIFGDSYGTRVALEYLRRHGQHVRTLALQAVAPAQYQLFIEFPRTIEASINALLEKSPALKHEFTAITDRLAKSPAQFEFKTKPLTLSLTAFISDLRPMLYIPPIVSQFPAIIHHAYDGDWTPYATAALFARTAIDKSVDRGMSLSVFCAEDIPPLTDSNIRRKTAGTYLGDSQVRLFQSVCREWPRGRVPSDFYAPVRSAVPALLIAGALDPATPPAASAQTARDLSNSRTVILKEGTHATASPCIDGLIADFTAQGSAAALDITCAERL